MTKIMMCTCEHKWQDEKYGRRNRVFNRGVTQTKGTAKYICTVCRGVRNISAKETEQDG